MEDVLKVYRRPHDPDRPLVCLDETSKQLMKIHVRGHQGRNASWLSQRQSVVPLIFATMPLAIAS
jgi:hypothetical protein